MYVTNDVGLAQGLGTDGYPTTVRRNLFVHPRSVVYAFGRATPNGPRMQEQPVGDALAMRIVADLMYGAKIAGSYEGVRIMTVK